MNKAVLGLLGLVIVVVTLFLDKVSEKDTLIYLGGFVAIIIVTAIDGAMEHRKEEVANRRRVTGPSAPIYTNDDGTPDRSWDY